jgi:hypothetical protein
MEVKSMVEYLIGRTMINLELICHVMDSHPAVVDN